MSATFVREHLVLFGLLAVLRALGFTEVRLEHAKGHPEVEKQCVFEKEGEGNWCARVVTVW